MGNELPADTNTRAMDPRLAIVGPLQRQSPTAGSGTATTPTGRVEHRVVEVRQKVAHLHIGHAACAQHMDVASLMTLPSDADDVLGGIADTAHVELRLLPFGRVLDPFAVPSAVRLGQLHELRAAEEDVEMLALWAPVLVHTQS